MKKHLKSCDKIKESLYHNYWDINNLYDEGDMPQRSPLRGFKWVKVTS